VSATSRGLPHAAVTLTPPSGIGKAEKCILPAAKNGQNFFVFWNTLQHSGTRLDHSGTRLDHSGTRLEHSGTEGVPNSYATYYASGCPLTFVVFHKGCSVLWGSGLMTECLNFNKCDWQHLQTKEKG